MPVCKICGRTLGVLNSNHLGTHNITMIEYAKQYASESDRVSERSESSRTSTAGEAIKKAKEPRKKTSRTKSANAGLTVHQERTIEDLYALNETIVIPDVFQCVTQDNLELLDELVDLAYRYRKISIDTETTGLKLFHDYVTDIIITTYDSGYEHNYFIPLYHVDIDDVPLTNLAPRSLVIDKLRPMLEDPSVKKVLYNDYFDQTMLKASMNISLDGVSDERMAPRLINGMMTPTVWAKGENRWGGGWDGSLSGRLLNENEPSHKLKDLYRKYLYDTEPNPQIKALGVETFEEQFGQIRFFRVPLRVATCYGAKDGYMTRRMEEFHRHYIDITGNLDSVMYSIEMPLINVLVDMKLQGIILDVDRAKELELELLSDRDRVEDEIRHTLGDINLNSPKQLSEALFGRLGMPDLQGGSTKAAVLEELAEMGYEIAAKITEYKKSDKLISTYLTNAADLVAKTGRVHCNFNQLGTKTGRFSSSDPNLQNIPARSKQGKKIRRIFRASPGYALISADYSQIEPRLLSDVCNDPAMIQSYRDGIDIYAMMASKVFSFLAMRTAEELQKRAIIGNKHAEPGQPLSKDEVAINTLIPVKKSLVVDGFVYYDEENELWRHKELEPSDAYDGTLYRMMMKTLLLGLMYSMSPKGFASRLKISEDDAKELVDQFYKAFPTLKQVMWELKSQCQKDGFIETPWGRKRRIPEVWSDDKYERFRAERQILNSKIQGGAADIMKIAMLLVGYDPRIKELGGRLLLTVHDELIVEAPKDNAIQVTKYLIEDMSNAAHLKVPLKVDAEVFTDGRWYGESITVKRKGSDYVILEEKEVITEEQINWAV